MKTLQDLNKIFSEAETCDKMLFDEQRSNVLLIAGDHYTKRTSKFWSRIREYSQIPNETKLRLTKNHIQRIVKGYVNHIVTNSPGVMVAPHNPNELQDQKAAQLNQAVWVAWKKAANWKAQKRSHIEDFVGIGETFAKVFYDPAAGDFKGYEQEIDEMGQPLFDEAGQPVASKRAVFSGAVVSERFHAFNVLRDPKAKSMQESRVIILRKMVDVDDLKKMVDRADEEKMNMIVQSQDETFKVFDAETGKLSDSVRGQVLYREFYFRPCAEYPKGYFYHCTQKGILFEGEIPLGIFPVKYAGFDAIPTHPRARSIVKVCRPFQAEINRAASKQAEHQITLGDDKVLTQKGTKLEQGSILNGIRNYTYTGLAPTILAGRNGSQFVEYISGQISEMYMAANYPEQDEAKVAGQQDPWADIRRNFRQKAKFSGYGEKIEDFERDICDTVLRLEKAYMPDDAIIRAIGRPEAINIPEFKATTDLSYQIDIEPASDDIDTMLGKQLTFNHTLQYVGTQLPPDMIGKILKASPFANADQAFDDMTIDSDTAENLILALDRGEQPPISEYDDPEYMIRRLSKRAREADFRLLDPQIQQTYNAYLTKYKQIDIDNKNKIARYKAGLIPTTGVLVKITNFLVPDPQDPTKSSQLEIPYDSLQWLVKGLQEQGSYINAFESLPEPAQASIANQAQSQMGAPNDMGMSPQGVA